MPFTVVHEKPAKASTWGGEQEKTYSCNAFVGSCLARDSQQDSLQNAIRSPDLSTCTEHGTATYHVRQHAVTFDFDITLR